MSKRISILAFLLTLLAVLPGKCLASGGEGEKKDIDVKEIIFEHLGDGYGWEVPFSHTYRMPLPCIVRSQDGHWFCFSSAGLTEVKEEEGEDGKVHHVSEPVVKVCERDGRQYSFVIAHVSSHKDKIVEIFPLSEEDRGIVDEALARERADKASDNAFPVIDGYVLVDGQYYREYRPLDLSVTKNVAAIFIAVVIVFLMVMSLARFYRKNGLRAPRKGMGFIELCVSFIYYDNIKPALGDNARKFAPYLLTVFFFILVMNLTGLVVIFPGGANLTGNIAVTLVLALCTFIITNVLGTKHYWKEIFWPDVPLLLKFPLPIMQMIELFGIFTKPAALCVRLFANMMGGHMIVITLTLLIFIFAAFGAAMAGAATVVSVLFSLFMLALDVLVSFIQAYVFTLLSALFIAMAQAREEHGHKGEGHDPEVGKKEAAELKSEEAALHKLAAEMDMNK